MTRKTLVLAVLASLLVACAQLAAAVPPGEKEPATRTLQGLVMNNGDTPLTEAVVYLKNTKTLSVKTFIVDQQGNYRFTFLSPNIDYEVYAEYKGHKSDKKTLSSFDSRKVAQINLKIDVAK